MIHSQVKLGIDVLSEHISEINMFGHLFKMNSSSSPPIILSRNQYWRSKQHLILLMVDLGELG
jgi:hypothetical protein